MKKTLAALLLTAAVFTTAGCGGGNKPAEEGNPNANAAVEQAGNVAQEVQDQANAAVDRVKALADEAAAIMETVKNGSDKTAPALAGMVPGANLDTAKSLYGEPTVAADQTLQFENGLDMRVDANNSVQEVSTTFEGLYTPGDIAVGMADYTLDPAYGSATAVTNLDNGDVVYKYVSKDNRRVMEFVTRGGTIIEIKCSLNQ